MKPAITVATMNLRFGIGPGRWASWRYVFNPTLPTWSRISASLASTNADVIVLQEASGRSGRQALWSREVQAADLCMQVNASAARNEYQVYYCPTIEEAWRHQGQAALIRGPCACERVNLPSRGGEPRCLVEVTIERGGRPVRVINVHLASDDPVERLEQSAFLVERMTKATVPVIAIGDFNWSNRDDYNQYRKAGLSCCVPTEPTYLGRSPAFTDALLFSNSCMMLEYSLMPEGLSDHRGICATLLYE